MQLDPIFDQLEVQTAPFALCTLEGRANLGLGRQAEATLHYILAGSGTVLMTGHDPMPIGPGSLILIPALQPHSLKSHGGTGTPLPNCQAAELGLERMEQRGEPATDGALLALCSHVSVSLRNARNLVDLIRDPLVETVPVDTPHSTPLGGALTRLIQELTTLRPGGKAMIRALMLECFLHLFRMRVEAEDPALAWMQGLGDEGLWDALQAMLDRPGDAHCVESLAATAGMGRSVFADRFQAAYGRGPMDLLRGLRMRKAAELLERRNLPVDRVAGLVGFKSRSAFSRSFQAITGQSPRDFRDSRRRKNAAGEEA